jgi:hemin uptake protein HemP
LTCVVKKYIARHSTARLSRDFRRARLQMTMRRDDANAPQPQPRAVASGRPRRIKVSELLDGEREAILEHGGQDYRLRITASGKLILTK